MQELSVSRTQGTKLKDEHNYRYDRLQVVWQGLDVANFDMMTQFFYLHSVQTNWPWAAD